ncbi:PREDICTED: protein DETOXIFICATION 43-like isoform X2 [Ipomoea nil]|uniref:protein DETOXIFICATION 43-like isoform X1 n=1 Tax=Ipomoea nil TaxID=35883 RepID=UPI0009010AEB|nr:PREDICTED: protein DETOXIFICATION 43-like isoform X1 [Ipomoea nil]XP_019186562.1 PREDICTED: protein DETOXIFICATION 43-like isoform X2 [Ipomoea nil]
MWMPLFLVVFFEARKVLKLDDLGREILRVAIPAALALAADPVASLIDTAFIGHLGAVEIAAVGVVASIINQANKVTIFPLVNITTSFVAEETTVKEVVNNEEEEEEGGAAQIESEEEEEGSEETGESEDESIGSGYMASSESNGSPSIDEITQISLQTYLEENVSPNVINEGEEREVRRSGRLKVPSASTALIMGLILGILQTVFLTLLARPLLGLMGVKSGSAMLEPALKYLILRSIGSPAVLLSLAIQGIFRGLKDTTTPLYATAVCDSVNVVLDSVFILACHWGVTGAAIAHVISQYVMLLILFCKLITHVELLPPSSRHLQLSKFLKNGLWLFARVIAATFCVTLASSFAARLGATIMAAFQVCLQVWLTTSLLADGLAIAAQAILAGAFAQKDYHKARATAARVLQMGVILGHALVVLVGVGLYLGRGAFSEDKNVLLMITIGVPFVAGTQPINTIAFVLDGVNFGASDFLYSAYSMVLVASITIGSEFLLLKSNGFVGIWIALAIFMLLRTIAGFWRLATGTGPWRFLRALDT